MGILYWIYFIWAFQVYGNVQVNLNASIRRISSNRIQTPINSNQKGVDKQYGSQFPRASSPPPVRTTKLRRYKSDLADRRKPNFLGVQPMSPSNAFSNEVALRLAEEWLKVQRQIDFWVAIEELSEDVCWNISSPFLLLPTLFREISRKYPLFLHPMLRLVEFTNFGRV